MGEERGLIAHRAGARVSVALCWDILEPGIEVRFSPRDERVPGDVLAIWEQAVTAGVRYALRVARSLPCGVRIDELYGDPRRGRPMLFAAAAAQAVWEALEFEPPEEESARLTALVEESATRGPLWLPEL